MYPNSATCTQIRPQKEIKISPYRFYFGFFGIKSQYFAGYYSARICIVKAKEIEENEEENEDDEEENDLGC